MAMKMFVVSVPPDECVPMKREEGEKNKSRSIGRKVE
jgi:hypothetical protein